MRALTKVGEKERLGRFGHHPDPATDFAVEVDAIEGLTTADRFMVLCPIVTPYIL